MSQPTYSSVDGYISEQFVTLHFDVALDAANPPPTNAFDVQINGTGTTVTGVTVDSAAHTVTLSFSGSALMAGDIIEFSYSDPTGGDDVNAIQGTDGTDAGAFASSTIVIGARPAPSAPPAPALSSDSDSGALGDGVTSDATPTVTGTAAANATVNLYDTNGTTLLGTTMADGDGAWSITPSALTDGDHTLKVTQTDSSSHLTSALSTGLLVHVDTTAPAIQSIAPVGSPAPTATTVVETVTFSEDVTGVGASDFTVGHTGTASARIASVTGSGSTYTVTLDTLAGEGTLHLNLNSGANIADVAGNAITAGLTGPSTTIDHVAPTVVGIVPSTTGPTSATTLTETVTFSESVTGVDADDFTISGGGTAAAHIDSVTGSGATYTVTLDGVSGDGTLRLDLNAAGTGIQDGAGNAIAAGATGTSTTIAPTPPPPPPPPPPSPTSGGNGDDVPDLRSDAHTPHVYAGQGGADVIVGGDGGDTLQGNTGDDRIQGGAGADLIHGGQGSDLLDAGAGNDRMFGDLGNDSVGGGDGHDTLQGNAGADTLLGGFGNDVLLGGQDQDRLGGGEGGDTLSGDLGQDTLQGNAGADALRGGAGDDLLLGGQGDDRVDGGDGVDTLSGDLGDDTLTGGAGADAFSFASGGGVDHVADFHAAEGDHVQLQRGAAYTLAQVGADTVIDLGHGDQLVLDDVQLASLPAGWILS